MDPYLSIGNVYRRILEEFEKHKSLVIAYDFDNTVYDYHKKGHTYDQMINLLRELDELGCYLIVFTANPDLEMVTEYCNKNNIPFHVINENSPFYNSNSNKIYYNALLDDRAGLKQTFELLTRFVHSIKNQR